MKRRLATKLVIILVLGLNMPYKKCGVCGTDNGVRSKVCKKCAAKFAPSNAPDYIDEGGWVYEKVSGMPPIHKPPSLPSQSLTDEDLRRYIEYHGLGYCVSTYIPPAKIGDKKLQKLWLVAKQALINIKEALYDEETTGE